MSNFYANYPVDNAGSSGVTSLNGQSGALTLVAGTNITIVPGAGTLTINAASGNFMNRDFSNAQPSTVQLDLNTHKIINVVDPTSNQDAATKKYVDDSVTASVTGDPNTVAFFNSSGLLDDNVNFKFNESLFALSFGSATVAASGASTFAFGSVPAGSAVTALATGSQAFGVANANNCNIHTSAGGQGGMAFGFSEWAGGAGPNTETSGLGSLAFGHNEGSVILSSGNGTFAFGNSVTNGGAPSTINASGDGSLAYGHALNNGSILSSADGSTAAGVAFGNASVLSSSSGAIASGWAQTSGLISAASLGSLAMGNATNSGSSIQATANGSFAMGLSTAGFGIIASGSGSHASGHASLGAISASAQGAFAHGDQLAVSADFATSFGLGNAVSSFVALVGGRYALALGTTGSWVATEPLFVLGNGTGIGSESNAFQIDKDGKLTITGAQVNSAARSVSASASLSARTDNSLFVDTLAASGAVVITFPAGVNGLQYFVSDSGNNASVNNITFAATGGDTVGPNASIVTNSGSRYFQYFNGVWQVVSATNGATPSSWSRFISSVSSPLTLAAAVMTDYVYFVSGSTTVTMPTAVGNTNLYTVKNTGVATVTIATTSSQTIDGSSTASMPVPNTSLDLVSNGSNWEIV